MYMRNLLRRSELKDSPLSFGRIEGDPTTWLFPYYIAKNAAVMGAPRTTIVNCRENSLETEALPCLFQVA